MAAPTFSQRETPASKSRFAWSSVGGAKRQGGAIFEQLGVAKFAIHCGAFQSTAHEQHSLTTWSCTSLPYKAMPPVAINSAAHLEVLVMLPASAGCIHPNQAGKYVEARLGASRNRIEQAESGTE